MDEKAKARAGLLYDANNDTGLVGERMAARDVCHRYNQLLPSRLAERDAIIRSLLGRVGSNCLIEPPFICDYGYNIEVGDYFYTNSNLIILDGAPVRFGDYVFVGPNCAFYSAGHPLDAPRRNRGLEYAYPITVGSNVWLGGNIVVLDGVEIGDNTVIGAGSVVTKNIPAGVVAAGNPCRVLREITDADRERYLEA